MVIFFSNGQRSLPTNSSDCIILNNWIFDNSISVDELFTKALQRFATYLLVINNLRGKLVRITNHYQNYQSYLMIFLKLLFYSLLQTLIY